jgi:simple sugar transport system permease protein
MPALFNGAHYYGPTFQAGLGFTGIAVALLGRNRPLGMVFGALLFAFLNEQSNRLTLETDISPNVVQITQGVIVLAVVVAYEVVRRARAAAEQRAVSQRLEATPAEDKAVTA